MVKIVETADGSHTLLHETMGHYHSVHGAVQESMHVFIDLGLMPLITQKPNQIHVFEMGLGTGLNALLTWQVAEKWGIEIHYTALETFPICLHEIEKLNYDRLLNSNHLHKIHKAEWEQEIQLSNDFFIKKLNISLQNFRPSGLFNLIYFDAFSPRTQPELWEQPIFEKIYNAMHTGGVLTTYCSKGYVQRNMKAAGFKVEKHPGPPHKTHILKAIKNL